ncbi:YjjW family glycine radical enzyme activase [Vibrio panuliri]|uniref:Glycine radical enzyme activase n=1 Tax=Vibrio panuliri TaxID=1381081 RepID=A0ABX3F365_9VIBR|nr:YjjW family glycine radical enzyme activase [Vibrio panuliri]KAB1454562.1 YjjW family glycine radical enzyme activase [Vibrio panuliri]OLQ84232.1 glycine radical enzyme activase [Vibrio panuliri]
MTLVSQKQAIVNRILNFSCVDGPGNRLVIFLQGCNFKCINCHNPYTINHCDHCGDCVSGCPTHALSFNQQNKVVWDESLCTQCDQCLDICPSHSSPKVKHCSVDEMLALIRKQHVFLSGITVSGGEATLQLPFIVELFKAIKADQELCHLTCFIDSNGYLAETGWQRVLPYLDGAMIDLKSWQNETHQWLVGRDNHRVIQSIRLLASAGKLHELRLLHIPGKSDLDQEIEAISTLINELPNEVKIRLNAFQHHGVVGEALTWQKCSKAQMEVFYQSLQAKVSNSIMLPSVYI